MSTNEKTRPEGNRAGSETSDHHAEEVEPQAISRRRDAARRLPVLACGCGDPWHSEPLAATPRNVQAARRAWFHLRDAGLLNEHVERVLAESTEVAA